jgi:hypothetical protein
MNPASPLVELVVESPAAADVRTLFPLMREIDPTLDLKRWLAYARPLVQRRDGRAGILVARRAGRRFPCGAVCYHLSRDLEHGVVLTAEHFITLDLLYPQAVLRALQAALEKIAIRLGCHAVRAIVRGGRSDLAEDLRRSGLGKDGIMMVRPVAADMPPPAARAEPN